MLANELSFGGSLPQTFSTIPRKNFSDRPYNKPGQVGYFKVVPRGYKCENMYPVILQVPVYIYVTSIGYIPIDEIWMIRSEYTYLQQYLVPVELVLL